MNIENDLIELFVSFIREKSQFGDIIQFVKKVPLNMATFPTIVIKESNNSDYLNGMTLNRMEAVARITYQIDVYTKDIIYENHKYMSSEVQEELKDLIFFFFNQIGFTRISCTRGEVISYEIDRTICLFEGKLGNWNKKIL